jgi:hypothetical protein
MRTPQFPECRQGLENYRSRNPAITLERCYRLKSIDLFAYY